MRSCSRPKRAGKNSPTWMPALRSLFQSLFFMVRLPMLSYSRRTSTPCCTFSIRKEFEPADPRLQKFSDMMLMNLEAADAVYSADNQIEIYTDGKEKFAALYEEIRKAQSYIHIQYYIIRNDELWHRPFSAPGLQKKQSEPTG